MLSICAIYATEKLNIGFIEHCFICWISFFLQYTANRIWTFLLRDVLPLSQRRKLTVFFDVLQELHSKKFTSEGIEKLKCDVSKVMVLLERDFPIWLCNINTHLVCHIVEKIADNGPLYSSWMHTFERMNSWLTRRAMNRSKAEECIMETAQVTNIL